MLTYPHFEPTFPREKWTLPYVLEHQATVRANKPFIQWTDENPALTYAETNKVVNRLAHGLAAQGVKKGDRVVLFLPNCLEYVLTWFALNKLGAAEVTVGDTYKGDFLRHQLNLSQAKIIITSDTLAERVAFVEHELPHAQKLILWEDPEQRPEGETKLKRLTTQPFSVLYSDNDSNPGVEVSTRDIAAVLFTSGTTGLSKGVLMPHAQLYLFSEQDVQFMELTEEDTYATAFPLFHGNAQFLTVYPSLIAGGRCVLYRRFSASDWLGRMRRSGATVCNLLGATMAFVLAQPETAGDKDHKLRCIYSAPTSPDLAGKFRERFGNKRFAEAFGQTEICLPFMSLPDRDFPPGACGVLVDQWFEIRLADPETGEDVPEGQLGELLVRNKFPFTINDGYLGMPEKTVEARRNLWFHTGDALKRDKDGWYYFLDRVKDALRRRGENISSFEVESVVRAHPAVAECAVIAVKADEQGGEDEVKACVILKEGGKVTAEEIIAWCDPRMPYFMVPRYIEFMAAFPQTPSEKIQKVKLREAGVNANTWDRVKSGVKLTEELKRAKK